MSFEGISQETVQSEKISDKDIFRARNEMQIKLAARLYGFEIDDDHFFNWEEKYSEKFAEVVKTHPDLLCEYVSGDSDQALERVSDLIYEKHEV